MTADLTARGSPGRRPGLRPGAAGGDLRRTLLAGRRTAGARPGPPRGEIRRLLRAQGPEPARVRRFFGAPAVGELPRTGNAVPARDSRTNRTPSLKRASRPGPGPRHLRARPALTDADPRPALVQGPGPRTAGAGAGAGPRVRLDESFTTGEGQARSPPRPACCGGRGPTVPAGDAEDQLLPASPAPSITHGLARTAASGAPRESHSRGPVEPGGLAGQRSTASARDGMGRHRRRPGRPGGRRCGSRLGRAQAQPLGLDSRSGSTPAQHVPNQ